MKLAKFERGNEQIYINIDTISVIKPAKLSDNTTVIATTSSDAVLVDGEVKDIAEYIFREG